MNLTLGSHSFHLSLTGLALVAGLAFGALWAGARPSPGFEAWLMSARQEVAATRAWLTRDRKDQLAAAAARAQARLLAARNQGLVAALDSAHRASLATATTPAESAAVRTEGAACAAVVQDCEGRVAHWARADTLDAQRADANARGWARADSLLGVGIVARQCQVTLLVVHVGCPSRTSMFFTGAAIVEALHLLLRR